MIFDSKFVWHSAHFENSWWECIRGLHWLFMSRAITVPLMLLLNVSILIIIFRCRRRWCLLKFGQKLRWATVCAETVSKSAGPCRASRLIGVLLVAPRWNDQVDLAIIAVSPFLLWRCFDWFKSSLIWIALLGVIMVYSLLLLKHHHVFLLFTCCVVVIITGAVVEILSLVLRWGGV